MLVCLGVTALFSAGLVVGAMCAALVTSTHPRYAPETSWTELRFVESLEIVGLLTIAAFVAMMVSVAIDKVRGCRVDLHFYPVPHRIRAIPRSALPRAVLAVGFSVIVGYLIITITAPWLLGPIPNGIFWPAERVLFCLVWTWITIWLAETVVRPIRTPMAAAVIFAVASLMLGCNPSMRPSVAMQPADGSIMAVRSVSDLIYLLGYEFESKDLKRIPPWATHTTETEHFIYHHAKGDNPVRGSLEAQERHYRFIKHLFHIELPRQIHYVKYPDRDTFMDSFSPGTGGMGVEGYVHSQWWFHPHEAVHTCLRSRNSFLNEGFAEAFGTTFYYFWGDISDQTPDMDVHRLYEGMGRLFSVTGADRYIACNFIRWLFHRYGPEKLVTVLREAYVEGGRTRDVIARIYGVPFSDLAAQWQRDQEWLSEQQPPEGFFAYPPWDREVRITTSVPASGDP